MSLEQELKVAREAAEAAASLVMQVYAQDFAVDWKSYGDPVTAADRQANSLIVARLRSAFPGDHVCAEEATADESRAAASAGGRCWFVDPLDGTREFVNRNGEFCVMVGLAIDGDARLGVLVAPATGTVSWGVVGEGAFEQRADGSVRALVVRAPEGTARLIASRSHLNERVKTLAEKLGIAAVIPCGSVGLKVARVASGDADLYVHVGKGPQLWDGCAPEAVARAAGAVVTDLNGCALRYTTSDLGLDDGIVVAHPALHARVIAVV